MWQNDMIFAPLAHTRHNLSKRQPVTVSVDLFRSAANNPRQDLLTGLPGHHQRIPPPELGFRRHLWRIYSAAAPSKASGSPPSSAPLPRATLPLPLSPLLRFSCASRRPPSIEESARREPLSPRPSSFCRSAWISRYVHKQSLSATFLEIISW